MNRKITYKILDKNNVLTNGKYYYHKLEDLERFLKDLTKRSNAILTLNILSC